MGLKWESFTYSTMVEFEESVTGYILKSSNWVDEDAIIYNFSLDSRMFLATDIWGGLQSSWSLVPPRGEWLRAKHNKIFRTEG